MTSLIRRILTVRIVTAMLAALGAMLPASVTFAQGLPKIQADRHEIFGKLVNYQFRQLDSELSSYLAQAESDPRFEMNAMAAFQAFETSQPLLSSRVDDWVKAMPDSYAASLARAVCLVETATRARGSGWNYQVRPDQEAAMQKYLRDTQTELKRALAIHENLPLAYAVRLEAVRLGGTSEEMERAKRDALAEAPASFAVREQIIYALTPRWGGSQDAMRQFAVASQYYAPQNPAMQFLQGWVALDSGDDMADQGKRQQEVDDYTEALKAGGEYWIAYRRRANAFYAMKRWDEALRDATRAQELFPDCTEILATLAGATAKLNQPDKSILWLAKYMAFEGPQPWAMQMFVADQAAMSSQRAGTEPAGN